MYFKIKKSSPLGQQLTQLWERIFLVRTAIGALTVELSDMDAPKHIISTGYTEGRLHAIQFRNHPGPQWAEERRHDGFGMHFYRPKAIEAKKNSALYQKFISANDPVSYADFSAFFGLKPGTAGSLRWFSCPAFDEAPEVYLVDIPDEWANKYAATRPADMIEILASEYHRHLEAQAAAKKETETIRQ